MELRPPGDAGTRSHPPAPLEDRAKRRQILEGARRVFLAEGFAGASMGEIARAAGVSKGTLYVYFDSKEALFEALTLEERGGLAEALFALDDADPDVRSVLRGLGRSFLAMLLRPEHISSVRMVIGAAEKFPRFGQLFYHAGPAIGATRLQQYLDRQVEQGRLAVPDTLMAAEQFLNLVSARALKRALFSVATSANEEETVRSVEAAVAVFWAAYAPDGVSSRKAAATRD